MKLLFTHSYFLQFDAKQVAHAQPYPPLGTLLAAAFMREHGHEVQLFDTMFKTDPLAIQAVIAAFKPDVLIVYDDGFNYLTKMCLSNMREAAFVMQAKAKAFGCKVIVTSSDAADHAEKYLDHGADFVIIGEAEYTLLELITAFEKNEKRFQAIAGIVYKENTECLHTPKRILSKRLDDLPLPAWDLVDIEPYRKTWLSHHGYFSLNIATTRGCPYKCNWCAKPMYGNAYNMRSPSQVIAELKLIKEKFAFDHIWFCDDIFGLKRSWVSEFAELIHQNGLQFKFKIQSRADLLVQSKYVEDLAKAGCDDVWMGAESGSQKILDAMDKGITVAEIKTARALLKTHGIKASFFIQFGYLGETSDDIYQTMQLIKETLPDDMGISVSYPLPGTGFYEKVKQDLKTKANWTDSDELALMFKNTYRPEFYKLLHRYVHAIYRTHLGLKDWNALKHFNFSVSYRKILGIPKHWLKGRYIHSQLKSIEPSAARSL